jgi:DnaJ-class molecular chaperone
MGTFFTERHRLTLLLRLPQPGSRAGDVIFTIAEKKEDNKPFQRIGTSNDLLYTQHLTLHEALTGAAFPIIHVDNRVLLVRPHEYGSFAGIIKTGDMVVIRVRRTHLFAVVRGCTRLRSA